MNINQNMPDFDDKNEILNFKFNDHDIDMINKLFNT